MSDVGLLVYGLAGFFMAIISSIASGGGGFVMTPLGIFLGLTPAEAIATGKLAGLSTTVGSLAGMKSKIPANKKRLATVLVLAGIAGIASSQIIVNLDGDVYAKVIGVVLVLIAPLIYTKKIGYLPKVLSTKHTMLGYVAVFVALLAQGTFSSGLGIFVSIAMILGLGLDALEANITKRTTQLLMNSVIIAGVLGTGLIVWKVALVSIICNFFGSYIGGKIAVKKGAEFVSLLLAILAFMSGVGLLLVQ